MNKKLLNALTKAELECFIAKKKKNKEIDELKTKQEIEKLLLPQEININRIAVTFDLFHGRISEKLGD